MPLMPAMLVVMLDQTLLGLQLPIFAGCAGHFAAGVVLFPLGWLALQRRTGWSALAAGAAWGIALWLVAQAVLAPLVPPRRGGAQATTRFNDRIAREPGRRSGPAP